MNLKTWKREKDLEKLTFQQLKSHCFLTKAINNDVVSSPCFREKKWKKQRTCSLEFIKVRSLANFKTWKREKDLAKFTLKNVMYTNDGGI